MNPTALLVCKLAKGHEMATDYVAWAVEMMKQGHDSYDLRILAGLDIPGLATKIEAVQLFESIIKELKIALPSKSDAIQESVVSLINKYLASTVSAENFLRELVELDRILDYSNTRLAPFRDLEEGHSYLQRNDPNGKYLYPELTKDNLDEMVMREAQFYLDTQNISFPSNFQTKIFCDQCGYFGLPKLFRKEPKWFSDFIIIKLLRRFPRHEWICPSCTSTTILFAGTYKGRIRLLGTTTNLNFDQKIKIGEWTLEFDAKKTQEIHNLRKQGGLDDCGCEDCRNFKAARDKAYPKEFLEIIEKLGIPLDRETEVSGGIEGKENLYTYNGWFHFVGRIIDAPPVKQEGKITRVPSATLIPTFSVSLSAKRDVLPKEFDSLPVIQIDFFTEIPWVVPKGKLQ